MNNYSEVWKGAVQDDALDPVRMWNCADGSAVCAVVLC